MSAAAYRKSTNVIASGATLRITRRGDFFHVISADEAFTVGFDGAGLSPFFAGLEYEVRNGEFFASVEIENVSADPLTITFGIGAGGVRDGRLTVSGLLSVADTDGLSFSDLLPPDTLTTGDPVSATDAANTQLAAANAARREIMMVNVHASSTIYIGGTGATAGQGIPVLAGQSLTLTTSAAIFARNDSGGAVLVAVAEMVAS
jgi:hypothetical protein